MPSLTGYFNPNTYGLQSEEDLRRQGSASASTPAGMPSYNDIVAANAAAHTTQVTTPGGQTFVTSDPNYSLNQYVHDTQVGNPFRKPGSVQDFATANGTPLSDQALHDYSSRYNDYRDSQHPNLQGIGGWMHNHPVGTIAAFIAAAAGGAALSGAAGGGAVGGTEGGSGGGGLGIFANGGTGGMAGVGGGNAGALAGSGGIQGGAGSGFLGSIGGGSGLLSQNGGLSSLLGGNSSGGSLGGLLGGGGGGGGQQQPAPQIPYGSIPNLSGLMGNQVQQQPSSPTFVGLPTQTQVPYIPSRGYTPHDFYGAKIWT